MTSARESLGKQLPPQPGPGRRNAGPMRRSCPMPSITSSTWAPTDSHIAAMALMNESFIARNPLAAYLIVSADAGSVMIDRRVEPGVQGGETLAVGPPVGADDHPVGVQEVVHRSALTQELRVRHHGHVVALQHGARRRAAEPTGTVDLLTTSAPGSQHRGDLGAGGLEGPEVGASVGALRGLDAQEHEVGVGSGARGTDHEREPARRQSLRHQLGEARLDDRDLTALEPGDALG